LAEETADGDEGIYVSPSDRTGGEEEKGERDVIDKGIEKSRKEGASREVSVCY
jgi:hypothetical protein